MLHFATLLDEAFVPRGLALHESMLAHAPDATLWVLCLDDLTAQVMTRLGRAGVRLLRLEDLGEKHDVVRADRTRREQYFAWKSFLARSVLRTQGVDRVTVVDGDMWFVSDPSPALEEIVQSSVALTAHRSGDDAFERRFGRFNAGFVSFRDDVAGHEAVDWWVDRCVEATPDYPVDGRFGEQRYLDDLADRHGTVVMAHPGVNVAPWNLGRMDLTERSGHLLVDGRPLVCFHFHGAERWRRGVFAFRTGVSARDPLVRRLLLAPYVAAWERGAAAAAGVGATIRFPAPWGGTRKRPPWWRAARVAARGVNAIASGRVLIHHD